MISQTFDFTAAGQSWVVPQGVTRITVELWGGQGNQRNQDTPNAPKGAGGYVKADLNVTPGTTYWVAVGGAGTTNGGQVYGGLVGAGGGSDRLNEVAPFGFAGGGGGATALRLTSSTGTLVLVAGGGGGAASQSGGSVSNPSWGGAGGGSTASAATLGSGVGFTGSRNNGINGGGGGAGTQTIGGAGGAAAGTTAFAGSTGNASVGGAGGNAATGVGAGYGGGGGGGGGGFFGGGGGGAAAASTLANAGQGGGGGGGSSYSGHSSVVAGTITLTPGARAGNGRAVISYKEPAPSTPTNITPSAGSVLNVSDPTLTAQFAVGSTQAMAKVEWTLAMDAGFTQNVRTYTQPDSAFQRATLATASYRVGSQSSDQLLSQGTWYIRARTVDQNGTFSGLSGTQSFRVEYPPTTLNHFPTGNVAVAFVSTGIVFAWDFISPSAFTDQIAYEVVVETNAGVPIASTGRVDTPAKETTINIPAARKGEQLRWRVRVWDSDNIQGPFSDYQLFRVVDGPQVTIANMTTVNTANPTVSYTVTPAVNTQITQRRLFITRDSDGAIVYDTGWR